MHVERAHLYNFATKFLSRLTQYPFRGRGKALEPLHLALAGQGSLRSETGLMNASSVAWPQKVDPTVLVYPAAHSVQAGKPVCDPYCPASHLIHSANPDSP